MLPHRSSMASGLLCIVDDCSVSVLSVAPPFLSYVTSGLVILGFTGAVVLSRGTAAA